MKNYVKEFMERKGRKPTEAEFGQMMHMSAKGTAGAKKSKESVYAFGKTTQTHNNLGGRTKIPLKLSENAIRINELIHKKFDQKTIAVILDLKETTVRNIVKHARLPRTAEQIES
jgi:DNA-binding NarL/FixJ family response regulator